MKINSVEYFMGDLHRGSRYTDSEFYEVLDEGNHVVAYVIRETKHPHFWIVCDHKTDKVIDRDQYRNDLFDRLERIPNDV